MICVCGASCDDCSSLGKECTSNCYDIKGRVFWAKMIDAEVCPVYKCADDKGYRNCGECPQIPCQMWNEMKDPNWTDEQHQQSIRERVKILTGGQK